LAILAVVAFFRVLGIGWVIALGIELRGDVQHIGRTKLDAKTAALAPDVVDINRAMELL